jgi:hypothetical protein
LSFILLCVGFLPLDKKFFFSPGLGLRLLQCLLLEFGLEFLIQSKSLVVGSLMLKFERLHFLSKDLVSPLFGLEHPGLQVQHFVFSGQLVQVLGLLDSLRLCLRSALNV